MLDPLFVMLTLPPLVIGTLAAILCALPGNFLVLRGESLIGDAVSHVVLPGIVLAFLITGAVESGPMVIGAAGAALLSVVLIEAIRRLARIEAGAAMGVVFTTLFAAGVLLLEVSDTSRVHLDVEHALYGNLESLIWLSAEGWGSLLDRHALLDLPPALPRLAIMVAVMVVILTIFRRPLIIASFDPDYARSLGLPVTAISFGLTGITALAAVAAFDAVGSIIVIAMFICPPAAARMMTHRLSRQIAWSLLFATASAVIGYVAAGYGPLWFGGDHAVSAAGMIATVAGLLLLFACLFGPCRKRTTG